MPRSIKLKSDRPSSFNSRENLEYANVSLKNGFCSTARLCSAWCPAGHTSVLFLWGHKSCAMHFKKPKFTHSKCLCHIQGLQLQPISTFVSRQTFSIRTVHEQYCDLSIRRKSSMVPHSFFHVISKSSLFPCDAKFQVGIYFFFTLFWCLGGSLDSPKHLLTVISAPGSADIDCQRDVSFLLFISSSLRDAAECKSAFSPWRWGRWLALRRRTWWRGEIWGGCRLKRWWKRAAGMGGEVTWVTRHASKACCGWLSRVPSLFLLFVFSYLPALFFCVSTSGIVPRTLPKVPDQPDLTLKPFQHPGKHKHKLRECMCLPVSSAR